MKFKKWLLENVDENKIAADKIRLKHLRNLISPLSKKGNLTATEAQKFKELSNEIHEILFDLANLLSPENVPAAAIRKSSLSPEVVVTAQHDLLRNKDIYRAITASAAGVHYSADTPLDDIVLGKNPKVTLDDLKRTFTSTIDALKKQYGEMIPAFRAVGKQKTKATENWATTREFAAQFGSNIIQRDIPINAIIAVNYPCPKGQGLLGSTIELASCLESQV